MDRFFGLVAPDDGWVPSIRYLLRRARILSIFDRLPATDLLEVGCGAGALLADFAMRGFNCIGLESSTRATVLARHLASRLGDPYRVVSDPDTTWQSLFGVVCAFDVLEHIEDDNGAIERWRTWLRPGGTFMLSVPAHPKRWNEGDIWAGHYRRYERASLLELLSSHGLRVVHCECYGFPLANFTEWVGRSTYRKLLAQRDAETGKELASSESGIARDMYSRHFSKINSIAGRFALRANFLLQHLTRHTNWGSGYLVVASQG